MSRNPNTVREGGNSGFQAVSLALHFGCARITLLGFDLRFNGRQKHWHGDHKRSNPTLRAFANWQQNFAELAKVAPVPIINATRETSLRCFPRMGLNESLSSVAERGSLPPGSVR